MNELAWRKEPPDKPGWWWVLYPEGHAEAVEVTLEPGCPLEVWRTGTEMWYDLYDQELDGCQWAGPIEPPVLDRPPQ